jgi:putative membrane protein
MIAAALASAVHMSALAIGAASVYGRARRLGGALDRDGMTRVLSADNGWGISAILFLASGLLRLFYLEKSRNYYFRNGFFWLKMSCFLVVLALEIWPMTTFIKWRIQMAKGQSSDISRAPLFRTISFVQLAILGMMVLLAALMARGAWLF